MKNKVTSAVISIIMLIAGDINNDGAFNVADLVMMQSWLLGSGQLYNWENGDLCKDNVIDVFDLVMMRRMIING